MNFLQLLQQVLSLIGALVLFLYGMKTMSEALQKIAGERLREVLAKMTAVPGKGILTGFFITALIQSSSATTVMVVSFVNAGLLSFAQSLGLIFGTNIGTTITAWIISLLGFGTNFSMYSIMLPLVALSLPLFFSYKNKNKFLAEFIIGFALLFIGIYFFSENLSFIDQNTLFIKDLKFFDSYFLNLMMALGAGILLTIIFQSSSATISLTMVLATQGWLSFDGALAMVLGENIGTAFTANVAALVANRPAKRTALAHLLFNLLGAIWALPLIVLAGSIFFNLINSYFLTIESTSLFGISIFHTAFNLINTMIFLVFYKPFQKMCFSILPNRNEASEKPSMKFINNSLLSTHELSILQARKRIIRMAKEVRKVYSNIPELLHEKREKKFAGLSVKTKNEVLSIGDMKKQIAGYIDQMPDDQQSKGFRTWVKVMRETLDDLEAIADLCFEMLECIREKKENRTWFTQKLRDNLDKEFRLMELFLNYLINHLENEIPNTDKKPDTDIQNEIKIARLAAQKSFTEEDHSEKLPSKTEASYKCLMRLSEKIGQHAFNINQTIHSTKNHSTINTLPNNILN